MLDVQDDQHTKHANDDGLGVVVLQRAGRRQAGPCFPVPVLALIKQSHFTRVFMLLRASARVAAQRRSNLKDGLFQRSVHPSAPTR
jgi:hypothetical protein